MRPLQLKKSSTHVTVHVAPLRLQLPWLAPSWTDGKKGYLGSFNTEEEAWAAIAEYKAEHVDS